MWRLQHRNRVIDSRNSPRSKRIEAYASRGQGWYVKHDYDKAIADFDHYTMAIAIDPKYTASYTSRGLQYEKLGDLEKARADFNAALGSPAKYRDGQWALDKARERLEALKPK
jgi:Tfp pilus assembly protein PilF